MEEKIINGKKYRLITLRGRSKWISADGDAYNPNRMKQRATIHMNRDGYPCFGGGIPVHLYVAYAWVDGWFDGAEVDHINYDRTDYSKDNLRWVTHAENVRHSVMDENHHIGTRAGVKNGRATFSEEEIDKIKNMFDKGMRVMDVIKELHPEVDLATRRRLWSKYNRIKNKETWA